MFKVRLFNSGCFIFFLIFTCIFYFSCASSNLPQNINEEKPMWVDSVKDAFPEELYIGRIGEGNSKKEARADAEQNLAKYFGINVKGETSGSEFISNKTDSSPSQELQHNFSISFNAELFGVDYTKPWYDKSSNSYFVCAYINRAKTFEFFEPKIISTRNNFLQIYQKAISEEDYFKQIPLLEKALTLGDIFINTLSIGQLIMPGTFDKYKQDISKISHINELQTLAKNNALINVTVENDINGKIKALISNAVTKNGFILSEKSYMYRINLVLETNLMEDKDFELLSSTPFIHAYVVNNKTGEELLNYSGNIKRISAYSTNVLNRQIYQAVESDLQKNFIPMLNNFLKR